MDDMKRYRVWLQETPEDDFQFVFECWADDMDHAKEQAENAYPDGVVMSIEDWGRQDVPRWLKGIKAGA